MHGTSPSGVLAFTYNRGSDGGAWLSGYGSVTASAQSIRAQLKFRTAIVTAQLSLCKISGQCRCHYGAAVRTRRPSACAGARRESDANSAMRGRIMVMGLFHTASSRLGPGGAILGSAGVETLGTTIATGESGTRLTSTTRTVFKGEWRRGQVLVVRTAVMKIWSPIIRFRDVFLL